MTHELRLSESMTAELAALPIDDLNLVSLDEQAHPGYLSSEVWHELTQDSRFSNVTHAARVFLARNNPGISEEALARERGFFEGLGFLLVSLSQHEDARSADRLLFDGPAPLTPSPDQAA